MNPAHDRPTSGRIIVFLKAPLPGFAKTRLAARLDDDAALGIYRVLLRRTFEQLTPFPKVELRYTPDSARAEVEPCLKPGWTARPQGDGDLGERMERAVRDAIAEDGPEARVVLIGTDSPEMSSADLTDAFVELGRHDLVVGPALDGGYWLLGVRTFHPALFTGIPWGTEGVLAATLERARDLGATVGRLRKLRDVDTLEDWRAWLREGEV